MFLLGRAKSAIAQTVADHYHDVKQVGASFFCPTSRLTILAYCRTSIAHLPSRRYGLHRPGCRAAVCMQIMMHAAIQGEPVLLVTRMTNGYLSPLQSFDIWSCSLSAIPYSSQVCSAEAIPTFNAGLYLLILEGSDSSTRGCQ